MNPQQVATIIKRIELDSGKLMKCSPAECKSGAPVRIIEALAAFLGEHLANIDDSPGVSFVKSLTDLNNRQSDMMHFAGDAEAQAYSAIGDALTDADLAGVTSSAPRGTVLYELPDTDENFAAIGEAMTD